MKLISPRVDLIEDRGIEGIQILEKIERIGRLCYKSEDKIGEGTAEKMVRGLIKRGHEAMIEHWSYIFQCSEEDYRAFWTFVGELEDRGWHFYLRRTALDGRFIISGNVRAFRDFIRAVFAENEVLPFWLAKMLGKPTIDKRVFFGDLVGSYPEDLPDSFYSDVKELCKEQLTDREKKVHYDVTIKFICDRGVTHEIVRHRPASFAQESTRYVSYAEKGKVEDEIDVISAYEAGLSMKKISEKSKGIFTEWEVYKILDRNDIPRRGLNNKGSSYNGAFKEIDTPEVAYLLGMIMADGSVREDNYQLTITQNVKYSWYLKYMMSLFVRDKISYYNDGSCKGVSLASKEMFNDLFDKGIRPNKSSEFCDEQCELLWDSIPEELKFDFLRGYLDGDGSVRFFLQNGKTKSCNISWNGPENLLTKISNFIEDKFDYHMNVNKVSGCSGLFRVAITKYSVAEEFTREAFKNFRFPFGHPIKSMRFIDEFGLDYDDLYLEDDSKFGVIKPMFFFESLKVEAWRWLELMYECEDSYSEMIDMGSSPQMARSVLPNSLKTEIVMTANVGEWIHFCNLRALDKTGPAHPQMKEVAVPTLEIMKSVVPSIFGDM